MAPRSTPAVLQALTAQCVKATFFAIGKHAMWHPEILRQVAQQGHTIRTRTWSHANLSKKSSAEAKDEIEKGSAPCATRRARRLHPLLPVPDLVAPARDGHYLGERNIAVFSTDRFVRLQAEESAGRFVRVMDKAQKHGKGIVSCMTSSA